MDTPLPTKWVFRFWNLRCMAYPLLIHQLTNYFAHALPLVHSDWVLQEGSVQKGLCELV